MLVEISSMAERVGNRNRQGKSGSLRCKHGMIEPACSITSPKVATRRLCPGGLPDAVARDAQGGVPDIRRVCWLFQLNGAYKHLS